MPGTLALPPVLAEWLAAGDRAAELHNDTVEVDQMWWSAALGAHRFMNTVAAENLRITDVFAIGARAADSPESALALLWNSVAFCHGRGNATNKRRIAAVADDRHRIGALLQEAAALSVSDPGRAFELLKPERGSATIDGLGAAGFTWFLYFAGGGEPTHPSQVLDVKVARSLRLAGWQKLRQNSWTATEYVAYLALVDRWRKESGLERTDLVVRGLTAVTPSSDVNYPWQAWDRTTRRDEWVNGPFNADELRQIYHWLALIADAFPWSTASSDFEDIGRKIRAMHNVDVSGGPRLTGRRDDYPYRSSRRGYSGGSYSGGRYDDEGPF